MECKLFEGIDKENLQGLLQNFSAKEMSCKKNQVILHQGEHVDNIYICLNGAFNVESVDLQGEVSLISHITEGGYFGGAFAFTATPSPADFRAISQAMVLIIPIKSIISKQNPTPSETKFLYNLISVLAHKSTFLITKIQHLAKRTIRGKITSYLSTVEASQGKKDIVIPFDRQGLADYLSVDRSALSKELSSMKADGLIDYHKNRFLLKF